MRLCSDARAHLHPVTHVHACKNAQASLHVYKYACCQTHALELIANNGCQLGSRCSRQHNWAQVDLFFQLHWRGETDKKWQTSE